MRFSGFAPVLAPMLAMVAPMALSACADPAPLYVDQAWVRLNPNADGPAAGYFTINGGEEATKLLRVTSEGALRIELHESVEKDGIASMQAIDSVDVPAKAKVQFAPGGRHLMIFGINPAVIENGTMTMTMLFANGDRLIVDAAIQKAGAATGSDAGTGSADGGNASNHGGH